MAQQQQIAFTMGFGVAFRTYHNVVVRKKITPRIPSFTPVMANEIEQSFEEQIGVPEGSLQNLWTSQFVDTCSRVHARIALRHHCYDCCSSE